MIDHNISYPISPEIVDAQIDAACARIEERRIDLKQNAAKTRAAYAKSTTWSGPAPQEDAAVDAMLDGWIARERDHYSMVRVVRLAGRADNEKSFVLVYGDVDDTLTGSGTGPFANIDEAVSWFTKGGR